MKRFSLTGKLLCAATAIFLSSCGGNDQKPPETDTTSTAAEPAVAPVSNIDTMPHNMMIVRHKVANFEKWLPSYEAHDSFRLASGVHSYVVGRSADDSNMVMVALKVDDIAKAKAFGKSAGLQAAMKQSGVVGMPKVMFLKTAYQDTSSLAPDILRSMTIFTVKDWDAWKKAFESHRQIRTDNGLTDRVYSYDADDNHKVALVVAINDSAKSNAFWKSDQIKQLRAESGVVGEPERFTYRVVKRY